MIIFERVASPFETVLLFLSLARVWEVCLELIKYFVLVTDSVVGAREGRWRFAAHCTNLSGGKQGNICFSDMTRCWWTANITCRACWLCTATIFCRDLSVWCFGWRGEGEEGLPKILCKSCAEIIKNDFIWMFWTERAQPWAGAVMGFVFLSNTILNTNVERKECECNFENNISTCQFWVTILDT